MLMLTALTLRPAVVVVVARCPGGGKCNHGSQTSIKSLYTKSVQCSSNVLHNNHVRCVTNVWEMTNYQPRHSPLLVSVSPSSVPVCVSECQCIPELFLSPREQCRGHYSSGDCVITSAPPWLADTLNTALWLVRWFPFPGKCPRTVFHGRCSFLV